MTIISTKCPILNKDFRNTCTAQVSSPDLEVLVEVSDCPGSGKATQIICPEYDAESKKCSLNNKPCHYSVGFQPL